ncbi:serine protease [Barnesiella viscericola]|uniref:S1C family serine protease n=1 Tax=Barnesiella viscericola TaxID=397865 RepID=UPI0025A3D3D3|nr:serine protease [Barnesiella viscericola]MDM8267898.1 serine protease [Barnesiella viscericola]
MKKQFLTFLTLILAFAASAQTLRETVAIVRPKLSESTQTFLTDFSKSLRGDGFYAAADVLQNYGKGSFGTGFVYRDKHNNRLYIITNRHVVEQADQVDIEFSLPDNSTKRFAACPVVGVHDDFDLAFIALPEGANVPALETTDQGITDGTTVFTAGFPALEDRPSWQFGQGIVSNANALIKSLTNSKELPLIQHTAQVDAGSSGGPLLIRDEQAATGYTVIGINTWKAAGRENTNFAIPARAIDDLLQNYPSNTQLLLTRDEVSKRATEMLRAAQSSYQAMMPFVSYQYVSNISADTFYDLVIAASDPATDAMESCFEQGSPLEGIRIGLADIICRQFSGKNYTFSTVASLDTLARKAEVVYTAGNKSISTQWMMEQGRWRLVDAENVKASNIEPNGISKSYGFGTSVYLGLISPLNNAFDLSYSLAFKRTILTFVTYEITGSLLKINTEKTEWEGTYVKLNSDTQNVFDIDFNLGGQLPVKCGPIYLVPYAKVLGGLYLGSELTGIDYGFGAGVEVAYKFGYQNYVFINLGYLGKKMKPFDDQEYRMKSKTLSGLACSIGISF